MLCCAAAAVHVASVCFHRGHQKRVLLPESTPEYYEQIISYVLGQKRVQMLVLGKAIYHAGRYVKDKALSCSRCVVNNMSKVHIYYIIPARSKTACKP